MNALRALDRRDFETDDEGCPRWLNRVFERTRTAEADVWAFLAAQRRREFEAARRADRVEGGA